MSRLGLFMVMAAFLGVLAFAVLGMTRNMSLAIHLHAALVLGISLAVCISKKSPRKAWHTLKPAEGFQSMHSAVVLGIGLFFMIVPPSVALTAEPGDESNSMTKGEQVYFACLFFGAGLGVSLIALGVWRNQVRQKWMANR